jgi:hypothetical protein
MQTATDRNLAVLAGVLSLVTLGAQAYGLLRARTWERLVELAADITTDLARLEGMAPEAKRREALRRLYDQAPPSASRLFRPEAFGRAVEHAWHLHAKPRLARDTFASRPEDGGNAGGGHHAGDARSA